MNNCLKLCYLKNGDHVAILQLLSFGKCSCLKNTDFICQSRCFFPTKLRRCIKDGYGTKVCTTSRVVFRCVFLLHIWFGKPFGGVFASPGIRSTLAMDTSSGTLLEVLGWDGFSSEVETSQQHRMREAPGVDRWHEFMNCWHGFFNHGQMMQALKLLHGFLLFVILYSCFFDIPERLCEIKHTWLHGLGYGKLLNFQPQLQVQWNMSRLFRNPVQDPFC